MKKFPDDLGLQVLCYTCHGKEESRCRSGDLETRIADTDRKLKEIDEQLERMKHGK